jgi:ankyrin repeat protein
MACKKGASNIVQLLLEAKANPNLMVGTQSPLASAKRFPKILQLLLEKGAVLDDETSPINDPKTGNSVLHKAASYAMDEVVCNLLEEGVDPRTLNNDRQTALDLVSLQILAHRTSPTNSFKVTAQVIQRLDRINAMLCAAIKSLIIVPPQDAQLDLKKIAETKS